MKYIALLFIISVSTFIFASEPTESKKNIWAGSSDGSNNTISSKRKLSKKEIAKKTLFIENLCKVIIDGDIGQSDPESRKQFYQQLGAESPQKDILDKATGLYESRCKIIAASKTLRKDKNELESVATQIGQLRKAWKQTPECNFLRTLYDQKYTQLTKNGAKLKVTNPKDLGDFLDSEVSFPL